MNADEDVGVATERLRAVVAELAELNAGELRDLLVAAGVRGWPGFPGRCPVAVYLALRVGAPVRVYTYACRVTADGGSDTWGPHVELPGNLTWFVSANDRGHAPELVAADYPVSLVEYWGKSGYHE